MTFPSPFDAPDAAEAPSSARFSPNLITAQVDGGRLVDNLVHFLRLLRRLGFQLPIDKPGEIIAALKVSGIIDPWAFYWALQSLCVTRRPERVLFDQAFFAFWKDPDVLAQMLHLMLPSAPGQPQKQRPMPRRLQEALTGPPPQRKAAEAPPEIIMDASETWSNQAVSQSKDFEDMSTAELASAKAALARLRLPRDWQRTRRHRPDARGQRLDLRSMLRRAGQQGGEVAAPAFSKPRRIRPPLVILCDVSGSMDTYARMLLHFAHAVSRQRDRVETFVFATQLSRITPWILDRDVDQALAKVSRGVGDWSGGTRLGEALGAFLRDHARHVLQGNATVLLVTDGLDREAGHGVGEALDRLRRRCRQVLWINPLLRYDAYAPQAAGARQLAQHVDASYACHSLDSLQDLTLALAGQPLRPRGGAAKSAEDSPAPALDPARWETPA